MATPQGLLEQPKTSKDTQSGANTRLAYASSAMQGHRSTMEDAHAALENLDVSTNTSFFGVYDGHGGCAVAKYCANHLHNVVREQGNFRQDLPSALRSAFFRMDEMLKNQSACKELTKYGSGSEYFRTVDKSSWLKCTTCVQRPTYQGPFHEGCTACVVLIRNNQIVVGNAGDARCVLSRNGQAIALSNDHKPNFPAETQRIHAAGGYVSFSRGSHRVNDGIAVSRAIGDLFYKQNKTLGSDGQMLTCSPEIRSEQITDDTEFLVIACDGVWDVLPNQEVVEFVSIRLRNGMDLSTICESLLNEALTHVPPSMDNMSAILVRFLHPDDKREGPAPETSTQPRRRSRSA
ncbi:probable protein phosphatase 2C 42 [Oryza brachyantha]|uniref:probable protein phosphatase 2C 42 n=1 Tax=Oryza brachyantha TaxID=4533 RepID=UPI0003EAD075|nr:probable protein phosphatase 2C 42 [Oryza brachyantha]XP_015691886.1 probable protein phosphatase 2C 42 [Oryza brachyantha]